MNTAKSTSKKIGLSPGSLVHVGEKRVDAVSLALTRYNADGLAESSATLDEVLSSTLEEGTVLWLEVNGIHDIDTLERIGEKFGIDPLFLEDIADANHRPKIEHRDDMVLAILKVVASPSITSIDTDQLSILLGKGFVISFSEKNHKLFAAIHERLKRPQSRARHHGPDYLFYALMDVAIDQYFSTLENLSVAIEELENSIITRPTNQAFQRIHAIRREASKLRRSVWALREIVQSLFRDESALITPYVKPYLRDLSDNVIQIIETVEIQREALASDVELYLTIISNRLNEIMKVLTIISTIFIPLTFIAGVYGMNFEFMPELKWQHGYFFVLGLMAVNALGMIYYFKKKKWF